MNFLKLRSTHSIQPYSFGDLNKRKKTADYWLSAVGALLVACGIAVTGLILYSDAHVKPHVAFAKSDWHVRFDVTPGCELNSQAKATCPADPKNPQLWSSDIQRESPRFLSRYETSKSEAFWIGLKVSPEQLKQAAKTSASTLVLPKLNGTVQVWIDGVYQTTHDFSQEHMPLQLPIAKSRLLENRDLAIAIGVFPYPHQPVPENRNDSSEGFFTSVDADRLTRSAVFFATSVHLIAVGLFLLIAGFLWSVAGLGRTRDFSVGTQLALLIALTSLMSVDLSFRVFNVALYESLYFSLLLFEVILIARFAWTILRGSRGTSPGEVALLAACFLVPTLLNLYSWIESTGVNLMTSWILPLTYLSCSIATSARLLKISRSGSAASKTRRRFLFLTAISTGLTAVAYFIESRHQSGFHVIWSRWINFAILFGLVRVFTKSHQTKSSLIELSPSSVYHKLEVVPDKVEGWLLQLEILKFSSDRQVMSTVLSHLWTITQLNDGVVIKADEGSLLVLFGTTPDGSEDRRFVQAVSDMAKCLKDLEQRLPIVSPSSSYSSSIMFRAAALKGSVKPSWHTGEIGISKIPMWVDIAPDHSIEATKRLLSTDLDAALRSNDASIVVLNDVDARRLQDGGLVSIRAEIALTEAKNVVAFIAARMASGAPKRDSKVG